MNERDCGLILRARPLTETSLIVHWLAEKSGRVATVAKGARRPKSPFRGKLDLFFLAEFSYARSRRSDLHQLREVSLMESHASLRRDLGWLSQASYATRLIERATEEGTPVPGIYKLMKSFLDYLTGQPPGPHGLLAFEFRLLDELGLSPEVADGGRFASNRTVVESLATAPWNTLSAMQFPEAALKDLEQFLHGFLIYHLGGLPPGRHEAMHASHKT